MVIVLVVSTGKFFPVVHQLALDKDGVRLRVLLTTDYREVEKDISHIHTDTLPP